MLAARVEPKNGPKENKKIGNFKPLVLSEFQAAVDRRLTEADTAMMESIARARGSDCNCTENGGRTPCWLYLFGRENLPHLRRYCTKIAHFLCSLAALDSRPAAPIMCAEAT